jgi:anti-sigma B factor antagonist
MSTGPTVPLKTTVVQGVTVVEFTASMIVSEQTVQAFAEALFQLGDTQDSHRVVVDFANTQYLSSEALSQLIKLKKKLDAAGGKLVLCAVPEGMLDVFLCTPTPWFQVARDFAEGLRLLEPPANPDATKS